MRSANGAALRPGVVAAILGLLVAAAIVWPATRPGDLLRDFNAFYCAGQTLQRGSDPYRAEPLGSCERAPKPEPLITTGRGLVAPAPLPPYALVPFELLAQLPYVAAALVWTLFEIIAVGVAAAAMRRMTNLPLGALVAAFALGDGYASLCLGQIAPFAVAAIAVAAMLLAEERDELAACAAGVAMLEPHIGLPVCASLFFWRSRTRLPLVGIALLFAATSVAAAGLLTSLEYVRDVLPAHALSEIANEKQFSLTYALHRLQFSDVVALRAGEIWYAAAFVAGIWAAGRLARRTGNAGVLAVIPPAFAVLGGPFVHIVQIAAALPAALVLYVASDPRTRRTLGCAIVMLAIPWIQFSNLGTIFIALAAVTAALLVWAFVDERPLWACVAGCAAVGFLSAAVALVQPIPDPTPVLSAHYDPRALAETSWLLFVRTIGSANAPAFDFAKLPTVAALVILTSAAIAAALQPMKTPASSVAPGGKGGAVSRRIALP
jgi:hypothetical protein